MRVTVITNQCDPLLLLFLLFELKKSNREMMPKKLVKIARSYFIYIISGINKE